MKIILIIITTLVGTLGWLKTSWFKGETPSWLYPVAIILLIILCAGQIYVEIKETGEKDKTKAESEFAGILKSDIKFPLSPNKEGLVKFEFGTDFVTPGAFIEYKGGPLSNVFFNQAFRVFKDIKLEISVKDQILKISALIRDKDGSVISELVGNEWQAAKQPTSWDRNYTKDALEVRNANGDVVLQVRALGDRIQLNGIFYGIDGHRVAISPSKNGKWAEMKILGPTTDPPKLSPIFKYPSKLHLGQFVDSLPR
jgi:hypothetical protein